MMTELHPELERRIRALDNPSEQGAGFTARDWFWLLVLGVLLPAAILFLGWPA